MVSSRFRLYALFLSGLGDRTISDTTLLRSGDGTHSVIESVAREVAALLRCAVGPGRAHRADGTLQKGGREGESDADWKINLPSWDTEKPDCQNMVLNRSGCRRHCFGTIHRSDWQTRYSQRRARATSSFTLIR